MKTRLLAGLVVVLGLAHQVVLWPYTMDDAYISFQYASNLVGGLGLVHVPGQYVKGFSNTSWTLVMALPEWLGVSTLVFSKALGMASFVVLCAALLRFTKGSFPAADGRPASVHWRLFPLLVVSLSAPVAVWSVAGMETGFYATLVTLAVLLRLEEQRRGTGFPFSVLFFCLVAWSRPEGIVFFVALAAHDLVLRVRRRRGPSPGAVLWYLLPPAAYALELYLSQRYFGDAFPNTYHSKVHRSAESAGSLFLVPWGNVTKELLLRGYAGAYLLVQGGFGLVALAPLAVFRRGRSRENSALLLAVGAQFAFICRVDGDWMPASRFVVPVLPFLALLLAESLAWLASHVRLPRRRATEPALLGALALLFVPGNLATTREVLDLQPVNARAKLREGRFLGSLVEPGSTVSSYDIGGIAYASDLEVLDTAGLTDRFLATWRQRDMARCLEYVWLQRPDVIRRHPGRAVPPDEPLYQRALASGQYVALDNERTLVRKALVFVSAPPPSAVPPQEGGVPRVVGVSLPPFVLPGRSVAATVYWERSEGASPFDLPALALSPADPGELASLAARLAPSVVWEQGRLLADRVTFRAPAEPGPCRLVVAGAPSGAVVATFEVVAGAGADAAARELLEGLELTGETAVDLALSRTAACLGSAAGEAAYLRLVLREAEAARTRRLPAAASIPRALAVVKQAKSLLVRAYLDLGRATPELRAEIEGVEGIRRELLDTAFARWDG